MIKIRNLMIVFLLFAVLLYSCARQNNPSGPVITTNTPVTVFTATSTEVYGTSTQTRTVTATFETWVPTPTHTASVPSFTRTRTVTATAQPSSSPTATATGTPAATATIYISGYFQGWNSLSNVVCAVTIQDSSDYSYLAATSVNLINLTHPNTINIPYDGANNRNYYINYAATNEYIPGDTYRLELAYGGNTYAAELTAPGSFTTGPYSAVNGIPFYWQFSGNNISFRLWDLSLGTEITEPYPAWNMPPTAIASGFAMPASKFITGNDYQTFVSISQSGNFAGADAGSAFTIGTEEYNTFERIGLPTFTATVTDTATCTETIPPTETDSPTITFTPTQGDTGTQTDTATPTQQDTPLSADTPTATATSTNAAVIPLDIALDAPGYTITTGGHAPFFGQPAVSETGGSSAQSGAISQFQWSWVQLEVSGPVIVGWRWKMDGVDASDAFTFKKNGGTVVGYDALSASLAYWEGHEIYCGPVPSPQVLRWEFMVNSDTTPGVSKVWLDHIYIYTTTPTYTFTATRTITPTRTATPTDSPYQSPTNTGTPTCTPTSTPLPVWTDAGTCLGAGTIYYNCTAADGNDVYLGYNDSNYLYAYKYNGSTWDQLGSGPVGRGPAGNRWLAAHGGNVYAVFVNYDSTSNISLKKYNSSGNTWDQVGFTAGLTTMAPVIWIDPVTAAVYIAFKNDNTGKISVMKYEGAGLVQVGNEFGKAFNPGNNYPIALTGFNNGTANIFIGYADWDNNSKAAVMRYTDSLGYWDFFGNPSGANGYNDRGIAMDTDGLSTAYIIFSNGYRNEVNAFRSNSGSWNSLGSYVCQLGSYGNDIKVVDANNVYAVYDDAYCTGKTYYATVMKFNGAAWSYTGGICGISESPVSFVSMDVTLAQVPYISYQGGPACSSKVSVQKFE